MVEVWWDWRLFGRVWICIKMLGVIVFVCKDVGGMCCVKVWEFRLVMFVFRVIFFRIFFVVI